ncbi:MAG: asparagine synthase (glutamine-hydrolyzing) [Oscillospiraceae bacterium]|nr:asparagine synthase (glutamine-hydrolyzing) [Oscillospiraceae bacterium]
MSGFVGFFDEDIKEKDILIKKMSDKIAHRGKQGEEYFIDDKFAAGARFSIIEPSDLDRLAYNEEKSLVIFFDGRIYNGKEIRAGLAEAGHVFSGSSDAETALHGYEQHGCEIAAKLRGAFAFVIYDKKTRELFGARDHFGVKPFYWHKNGAGFMFGSEIKSFLPHPKFKKEINKAALKMYLIFQYSALEETFFKGVFRLPPGCWFTYKNGAMEIARYFEIEYKTETKAFGEYADILEKTLKSSIELHKSGEIEVAGFLSGGVDSSFIASVAKPQKTFSVGFAADGFDESIYAKQLSDMLGLENHKKIVSADEFFEILPTVQYLCDEPYANLSGVPLYYLSQMAAAHVKAALTGEGSDEFFSGYLPFAESRFSNVYSKLPFGFRRLVGKLAKSLPNFKGRGTLVKYGQKVEDYYIGQAFIMDDDEANGILSEAYKSEMSYKDVTGPYFEKVKNCGDLIKKSYLDLFLWLPNDILLKADRMTSAHSLETRAPILDREVFALASKIPKKYLIKNKVTKWIFREVANRTIPPEWAKRKKLGFPVPFKLWLKEPKYRDMLKNMFEQDFAREFFATEKLLFMLDEHFQGKKNNGRKLYTAYSFLLWHKAYFKENI